MNWTTDVNVTFSKCTAACGLGCRLKSFYSLGLSLWENLFFFLLHIVIWGAVHMKLLVGPSLQSCWLNISLISHGQSESLFRNPRNRVACMDGIIPDNNGRFVVTIKLAETPPLKSTGGCAAQTDLLAVNQSVKASAPKAGSEKHSASEHWDSWSKSGKISGSFNIMFRWKIVTKETKKNGEAAKKNWH